MSNIERHSFRHTLIKPDNVELAKEIIALSETYETLAPIKILEDALKRDLFSNCAMVSSFGADSAVLLHMLSLVAPATPVILIDTGKLFGETLRYVTRLQHTLGLEDVRSVAPKKAEVDAEDPLGTLSATDANACCQLRKTRVLDRALTPFSSWITGRKRHQTEARSLMAIVERDGQKVKLNPLSNFTSADVKAYLTKHRLPAHPLLTKGYASIGCRPCTSIVKKGQSPRAGRWPDIDKTECGIH